MAKEEKKFYKDMRKKAHEFEKRSEYLDHELKIMSFKRWRFNLPIRDWGVELEDWVPALAATIGKVVMVTAMVAVFATEYGLDAAFVAENVRWELLIGALFVILFSALLMPNANLAGTHGPMIPLIPLIAAAGGHPLSLGLMVAFFGLILAFTKGGSKLMTLTGVGVRGGLLIYLGAVGLIGQIGKLEAWAASTDQGYISFAVIGITLLIYAYLAKLKLRWVAIPVCSIIAGVVAFALGAEFHFTTTPGLPHMSPLYWWGETTGWQLGWPNLNQFIAVTPFALLAVAMWSPDYLGHRVFQELNYPKRCRRRIDGC
ncbi:conserved hypothetical membrane protein [Desulfotalea psychrophila LSv54]|uniref:Conserved hypothetical membrane protein n=1 Tax=Desulfotalea psychrophila (strain LSv54 / DSM 12343) TaxID=177439 RepID=Q6AK80_DESPS|nr:DUF3360 family protein [Desulfotalea psychrophila]CAG37246.1 conserved hypothetical membrane protein [Desulfotalea psychrophila LSv54]